MMNTTPQFTWDHIHILTTNEEQTIRWFADILGAEIVKTPARTEARFGPLRIFFQQVSEGDKIGPSPAHQHRGLDHFALFAKDVDAVAADLKAKGVKITKGPVTPRPGVRVCFIEGPDGISIELLERDEKYK